MTLVQSPLPVPMAPSMMMSFSAAKAPTPCSPLGLGGAGELLTCCIALT